MTKIEKTSTISAKYLRKMPLRLRATNLQLVRMTMSSKVKFRAIDYSRHPIGTEKNLNKLGYLTVWESSQKKMKLIKLTW